MRIAIVKPDHHATGGFEAVLDRLAAGLRTRGHVVELAQIDATGSPVSHIPAPADEEYLVRFRDFFFHLNMVARFEQLDLSGFDVALCTQPGSYAARHPRKVILFYHHSRSFYDLQDIIETVRGHDIELHQIAAHIVRDVDAYFLRPDVPILAGSRRVKERLAQHNGLTDNVEVFSAGIDEAFWDDAAPRTFQSALCVGRHEFPKRTELFLHAMYHVDGIGGRIVGAGSFTDRMKGIDAWLQLRHLDEVVVPSWDPAGCLIDDHKLWLQDAIHKPNDDLKKAQEIRGSRGLRSPAAFLGWLSQDELLREYRSALCVVCPAFDEDYGLTCLEAMACGKPVVACHDGGGYVELIADGVDGFLVEPNGPSIAAAITRLKDLDLARSMGERGREKARAYTWNRAIDELERMLMKAGSSGSMAPRA
jgi:glycosyltransferase involved in cell wall biosynthesis